jgi:cytochrome c biogenesis protein CcmG/thiol:disulfide interchange protein DsbE
MKCQILCMGFVVAVSGFGVTSCGGESADEKQAESPSDTESRGLVGSRAPDFSVVAMAGHSGRISLRKLRGKVVVVDFWGTFCEPCKKSFPKLQELNAKYADSGLEIVAISEDEAEDKDKIPGFVNQFGAKFNIGWDPDKSVARHYNPPTMPSSYVIDRKGRVRYEHAGYHDEEDAVLEKELKKLLSEN